MSEATTRGARRPVIGVIGDGHLKADSPKTDLAEELGKRLVESGYRIACGGLGGVMEAVCRGAGRAKSRTGGDTIGILPGPTSRDANRHVDIVLPTNLSHARNTIVAQSRALIAIGGGAGTLTEIGFGWIMDRLIIAFRVDGWSGRLADERLDQRERIPGLTDDRIFGVETPLEAVEVLERRLELYDHN